MKVLIIDDEKAPREILANYIRGHFSDLEIIGESDNVIDAEEQIYLKKPELIFLDMELGSATGFDLLDSINLNVKVIVISGYPQFALRAFRYNVMDYLIKPLKLNELEVAVEKVRSEIGRRKNANNEKFIEEHHNKIAVKSRNNMVLIDEREIVYLMAEGSYTWVVMKDESKLFVTKQLKYFEGIVNPNNFVRVHHSYIVNLGNEHVEIDLKNNIIEILGHEIPISVRKKGDLLAIVKGYSAF